MQNHLLEVAKALKSHELVGWVVHPVAELAGLRLDEFIPDEMKQAG
jgi:hypothetical protein